ncbi:MAG: YraN family protein [Firmicutes bacterium]|nr:YraN family protein [Bacillota bacterium]
MTTKEIGDFGEDAACEYLEKMGYEILERNFRVRAGEIDIIADDDGCTVFAEVKTRKNNKYGEPSEYVDAKKIEHIKKTALIYITSLDKEMRFDVVEVIYTIAGGRLKTVNLNHIKDAF